MLCTEHETKYNRQGFTGDDDAMPKAGNKFKLLFLRFHFSS